MAENIFILNPLTAQFLSGVATQLFVLVCDNDLRTKQQVRERHANIDIPRATEWNWATGPPGLKRRATRSLKNFASRNRFVAVYMVWPAPQLEWLRNVGAVGVKTHSFCWLDYRPDGRDLLGIADTTSILELRNLILVEPFSGGKDCLTVHGSGSPPRRGDGLTKLHHVGPDGVICFKSSSAISTLFLSSHFHQILCPLFHMLPCIVLA